MKKVLMVTNMVLLVIILMMACNQTHHKKGKAISTSQRGPCNDCKDYTDIELQGIISADVIQSMSRAYAADNGKSKITGTGDDDALSLVFDLEKIKNFIWHMEHAVCEADCDSLQELGIRFYYIKYDTSALTGEMKNEFSPNANKHSLAMVPAFKRGGEWFDFDMNNVKPGCSFDKIAIALNKFQAAGLVSIDADNHGGMGPPPKPGFYPTIPE